MAADPVWAHAANPRYAPTLPVVMLVLFGLVAMLYRHDVRLYVWLLDHVIQGTWEFPFLDWINMPATIACWQQGVDVYTTVPCDPLNRAFVYSPLWLRLGFIPTGPQAVVWTALGLVVLFIATLGFLPQARSPGEFAVMLAGCCSSATILLIERGNIDLLIFTLAVATALCLERGLAVRIIGYGLIVLAGLLKFYPLVLLLLLLRERPAIAAAIGLAATALVGGLAYAHVDELMRAVANVPRPGYFQSGTWAAMSLPAALGVALHAFAQAAGFEGNWVAALRTSRAVGLLAVAGLSIFIAARVVSLLRAPAFRHAFAALPARDTNFLLIGGMLICGCFFAGPNILYRAVFLLLTLPGLLRLAGPSLPPPSLPPALRRLFAGTIFAILFVMWQWLPEQLVYATTGVVLRPITNGPIIAYLYWLSLQLAIWWSVATLLAILASFALHSTAIRTLFPARRRP